MNLSEPLSIGHGTCYKGLSRGGEAGDARIDAWQGGHVAGVPGGEAVERAALTASVWCRADGRERVCTGLHEKDGWFSKARLHRGGAEGWGCTWDPSGELMPMLWPLSHWALPLWSSSDATQAVPRDKGKVQSRCPTWSPRVGAGGGWCQLEVGPVLIHLSGFNSRGH